MSTAWSNIISQGYPRLISQVSVFKPHNYEQQKTSFITFFLQIFIEHSVNTSTPY